MLSHSISHFLPNQTGRFQSVEHGILNPKVLNSIPTLGARSWKKPSGVTYRLLTDTSGIKVLHSQDRTKLLPLRAQLIHHHHFCCCCFITKGDEKEATRHVCSHGSLPVCVHPRQHPLPYPHLLLGYSGHIPSKKTMPTEPSLFKTIEGLANVLFIKNNI